MRWLAFASALLLAACAELPVFEPDPVDAAVAEAVAVAKAPVPRQRAALAKAEQRFVQDPSVGKRLALATLLVALPGPLRDDARAAELLEPIVDPAGRGPGRFAALLAGQIAERQRLARELDRAAREAERTAKDRAAADRERDKREEAMREQLEALRAIERNILEREERLRRRPR